MNIYFLVFFCMTQALNGQNTGSTTGKSQGITGRGFGFPLYEFGSKNLIPNYVEDKKDVLPMDLNATVQHGQCSMMTNDFQFASNTDVQMMGSQMRFTSWLAETAAAYKKSLTRRTLLRDEQETTKRDLNIFLPNNMRVMTPTDMDTYPARTVGRLVSVVGTCSATIIHTDLVLTNRHCLGITSSNTLPANFWSSTYMQIGLTQSVYNYKAYFGRVRWSSTSNDYAILQLLEPIGSYTGWPGITFYSIWDFLNANKAVSYIGYSGVLGGNAGGDFTCHTRNGLLDWDDVHHDCDATRGSSGSAIMTGLNYPISTSGTPMIVALNYGEYRDGGDTSLTLDSYERSHRNVAKPASVFESDFWAAVAWAPFPTSSPTKYPTLKPTTKLPTAKPTTKLTIKPTLITLPPIG